MIKTTHETATCPNCDGKGVLPHFRHISNGVCFWCKGTGQIHWKSFIGDNKDVVLEVFKHRGEFWHAFLRCRTWKTNKLGGREWGKDLWSKRIEDADEARNIWRNAKHTGIVTMVDEG